MTSEELKKSIESFISKGFRYAYNSRSNAGLGHALTFKMVTTNKKTAKRLAETSLREEIEVSIYNLQQELDKLCLKEKNIY